jgi:parallel beta-helix repeat protein
MKLKFYQMKKLMLLLLLGIPFALEAQYCTFTVSDGVEPINRVDFITISNISTGTIGYEDFTSISASVTPGSTYPITLYGNTAGNWTNHFIVFIDWNGNQNFTDAGESYPIGNITNCTNCSVTGNIVVPGTLPVASVRMRVVKGFGSIATSPSSSCASYLGFGQGEDYTINTVSTPCAGAQNGGTATASAASVCPSANFTLSVTGASIGTGLTYQWQSSPDAIVWTNIAGATSAGYTSTHTAQTHYRRKILCSNGPDSAFSTPVTVGINTFLSCYCSSAFTNAADEKITNVTIGTINNTTGGIVGGPVNYTAQTTDVIAGNTHQLSVSYYADGGDYVRAYIDWNQNGVLDDAGEVYVIASAASSPGTQTVGITVPTLAALGNTRLRVMVANTSTTGPCISTTYGEAEDYTINVLPPPVNEAGITAITRPSISTCTLGSEIWVNLQNLGSSPLTQVNFALSINGANIPTVNNPWTGSIASGATMEVQVPVSYTLSDGDSISVTVSLPNGQPEDPTFAFNNQKGRRVHTALSGIKTVYGTNPDYTTLADALLAVRNYGICGDVFLQVASGTYNVKHTLLPYLGAASGKRVYIESQTGNAADVVFEYAPTSVTDGVFVIDGAKYYTIRNISAKATGSTNTKVITMLNNAANIEISDNIISADTVTAYSATWAKTLVNAYYLNSTKFDSLVIKNNLISGGLVAIDIEVGGSEYSSGIVIEGNELLKTGFIGIVLANAKNPIIRNNTISIKTGMAGTTYGMELLITNTGGEVSGNNITLPGYGYGMYLSDVQNISAALNVFNNMVFIGETGAANAANGIYIDSDSYYTDRVQLANNSVSINSGGATRAAINLDAANGITIRNNNLGSLGAAPVIRSTTSTIIDMSNNNIFGTNLANINGTAIANLTDLPGQANLNVNPGFSGSNLHTCTAQLDGAGQAIAFVTVDIDGDARGTTPDIGADEFMGSANGLLVQDSFEKCPADQVTIGNAAVVSGVTYSWTPSGSTSQITTSNAGTFVITATSSCGVFKDTATVVNKPLPTASFTSSTVGLAAIFTNTSTNGTGYLWDFGDGNSSTDANPTHVYSSASTYSVSLTVTNACGSATFGPTLVNVINSGIEENASMQVSLFPNPTNGTFNVTLSDVNGSETVINVIDVTGKSILVKNIAAGVNQATLDATTFASGIYSVKISNGEFTKVIRLVRK